MAPDPLMVALETTELDAAFVANATSLGVRFAWQLLLYLPEGASDRIASGHRLRPWPRQCHDALVRLGVDPRERPSRDELRRLHARSFPAEGQARDPAHEWRHPLPLAQPLTDLDSLALRPCRALARIGITHLWQLLQHDVDDLVAKGYGQKSSIYLGEILYDHDLRLGLDLPAPLLAELQEIAPPHSPPAG